jgi:hypothetical protein
LEGIQLLHGGFLLFNPANLSRTRAPVKQRRQTIQFFGSTHGIDVDPPVGFVPHPSGQSHARRLTLNEPTESNALHAP